jgi:hypothetical protein
MKKEMKTITKLSTENINNDIACVLYIFIGLSWLEFHSAHIN